MHWFVTGASCFFLGGLITCLVMTILGLLMVISPPAHKDPPRLPPGNLTILRSEICNVYDPGAELWNAVLGFLALLLIVLASYVAGTQYQRAHMKVEELESALNRQSWEQDEWAVPNEQTPLKDESQNTYW